MGEVLELVPDILAVYRRDPPVWTQGLQWYGGFLYESAGAQRPNTTPSVINQLRLGSKLTVEKNFALPSEYFAEGLARDGTRLYQLTLDFPNVFVYELEPEFKPLYALPSSAQGIAQRWGLCFDPANEVFYLSYGTDELKLYTRQQFEARDLARPKSTLLVTCNGEPVSDLNGLEFANGFIYAASRKGEDSNWIVQICPASGEVAARIDADHLRKTQHNKEAKDLSGIAFYHTDPFDQQPVFLLTGKLWSLVFEVKFVAKL